jgi:transposase
MDAWQVLATPPERYGLYTICYNRFMRWRKAGLWDRLVESVSPAFDSELVMIDISPTRSEQRGVTEKGDQNAA